MSIHPEIAEIASRFEAQEIHAARSGREVMKALASVVASADPGGSLDCLAEELVENAKALLRVMPPYAPPLNVVHRILVCLEKARSRSLPLSDFREMVALEVESYLLLSEEAVRRIAQYVTPLIPKGGLVFTFTLSETVLGVLGEVAGNGVVFSVVVTESQPNRDGVTTAKLLAERGATVGIGLEAGIGDLVPRADVMLVGAEGILTDGGAICKIGTYPAALVARKSSIPVYVVVDTMKIYPAFVWANERFPAHTVVKAAPARRSPGRSPALDCLFELTPADLITAIVTEQGPMHPSQVARWAFRHPHNQMLENVKGAGDSD